jgi:hypothetical protein
MGFVEWFLIALPMQLHQPLKARRPQRQTILSKFDGIITFFPLLAQKKHPLPVYSQVNAFPL